MQAKPSRGVREGAWGRGKGGGGRGVRWGTWVPSYLLQVPPTTMAIISAAQPSASDRLPWRDTPGLDRWAQGDFHAVPPSTTHMSVSLRRGDGVKRKPRGWYRRHKALVSRGADGGKPAEPTRYLCLASRTIDRSIVDRGTSSTNDGCVPRRGISPSARTAPIASLVATSGERSVKDNEGAHNLRSGGGLPQKRRKETTTHPWLSKNRREHCLVARTKLRV